MTKRRAKPKAAMAWAWTIENMRTERSELCFFAGPREMMMQGGKPSPESKLIRVRIVPVPKRAKRGKK